MPTFEENLAFEKSKKPFFNKLYRNLGFEIISRKDCKEYDCKLRRDGFVFIVEEKALRNLWDDICIETIQDTETNADGWIYYSKADFLVYGMFDDQIIVYRLPLRDFKVWFEQNIENFKEIESKKGWGITINKIVPIKDIPNNLIKRIC